MKVCRVLGVLVLSFLPMAALRAEDKKDEGFVPMFNGKDLTGWVNVNCHPDTFFVKDDMIITTGKPTGFLRTTKQYENFIAEFDWFHVNTKEVGNSGFFVWADPIPATGTGYTRGIEVQVLVNLEKKDHYTSQGDLFSIWGATCKPVRPHPQGWSRCLPSENRCKGGGEWNHYKVIADNGVIKLHVNGKEVSGVSECNPRKGYLALESEGAECRFRNLKIKELPTTNPKKEEIADEDKGFTSLYTGLDLKNWKAAEANKGHWKPSDWVLHADGKGGELLSEKEFGDYELIVDWKLPAAKKDEKATGSIGLSVRQTDLARTGISIGADGKVSVSEMAGNAVGIIVPAEMKEVKPAGQWNRTTVTQKGDHFTVQVNGKTILENIQSQTKTNKGRISLSSAGAADFANIFIRELK